MTGITIRHASPSDIPVLCRLEKECFSLPWSEKSFEDFFGNGVSRCFVAELCGEICGYVGMNLLFGEGEITNIAVDPKFRRMGVGSALMARLFKEDGLSRILLDVRLSNTSARAMYERLGFTADGVRKGFYEKPREDALLMSKLLTTEN